MIGLASALIVAYYMLFSIELRRLELQRPLVCALAADVFFFIYPFDGELTAGRKAVCRTLFAVSAVIAVIGLINPWSVGYFSQYPLIANIKQMSQNIKVISHR